MATYAREAAEEIRDGRRLRGERTRLRVLEALLELIEEGELHPTAYTVAERAGVALRTVYHHFEDVAELRSTALGMQLERFREMIRPVAPDLSLDERIRATAHQYRRLFEAMTPLRRAALLDQQTSEEVSAGLRQARERRRAQLAETFGEELERRRGDGRVLLDALDVLVSWDTWHYLRSSLGRQATAAERVLVLLLADVFGRARAARAADGVAGATVRAGKEPGTAPSRRRRTGRGTKQAVEGSPSGRAA